MDIQAMRQALDHLYSSVELANSELTADFPEIHALTDTVQRAQALRSLLLDAIEQLRPLRPAPPHVLAARSHTVLSLRYISGLSVDEIAEQLSIGERQVYRDLRRAEEELMAVLMSSPAGTAFPASVEAERALQTELAVLDKASQVADMAELLQGALQTVEPLATQLNVRLLYDGPPSGVRALVPRGLMGQVLLQLLSASVQAAHQPDLRIQLGTEANLATLRILPVHRPAGVSQTSVLDTALSLAESSGLDCELVETSPGLQAVQLTLCLPPQRPVVFVEDNPATRKLYQRYLEETPWQPVLAPDPRSAADITAAAEAAAVVIDLLMPELDGWTVLQTLKLDPRTASVPVIVCSVVTDSELARALGAAASLKKPLTRADLLQALQQVARPCNVA